MEAVSPSSIPFYCCSPCVCCPLSGRKHELGCLFPYLAFSSAKCILAASYSVYFIFIEKKKKSISLENSTFLVIPQKSFQNVILFEDVELIHWLLQPREKKRVTFSISFYCSGSFQFLFLNLLFLSFHHVKEPQDYLQVSDSYAAFLPSFIPSF